MERTARLGRAVQTPRAGQATAMRCVRTRLRREFPGLMARGQSNRVARVRLRAIVIHRSSHALADDGSPSTAEAQWVCVSNSMNHDCPPDGRRL